MIRLVLVGTGNVAQNLFWAFKENKLVQIVQVVGRTPDRVNFARPFCKTATSFNTIENADVYIIAVSDDVITEVSKHFTSVDGLVVHTSGATSIDAIANKERRGVFYPLQTFTKGKLLNFKTIPLCIEASLEKDYALLETLGKTLSNKIVRISSTEREKLHVAAVFANNFANYMFTQAADICEKHELDFSLLKPLILETASKLQELSPKEAQTGPAKRGDQKTLHNHINILKDKQKRELYTLLSNAIKHTHGEKL